MLNAEKLLKWYDLCARDLPWRHDADPYRVWVSEVMLQQTRAETVIPYYQRFLEALPTVEALARAETDFVLKLWQGLGYYSRARNLQKGAREIVRLGGFPGDRQGLLSIPGIGPYTAGAIASICFNERTPAVDGNALRVLARTAAIREDISQPRTKRLIEGLVQAMMPDRAGDFNQALMDLGSGICTPRGPKCAGCPLSSDCGAHACGIVGELPVKSAKPPPAVIRRAVFLLATGDGIILRKRPESGLLGGLWEFPGIDAHGGEEPAVSEEAIGEWGMEVISLRKICEGRHRFTHVLWLMTGYLARVRVAGELPGGFAEMDARRFKDAALPSAMRFLLPCAGELLREESR